MNTITTLAQLEAIYVTPPAAPAMVKEVDRLIPAYQKLIALSPFVALATSGPGGLDCSPRGDRGQVVRVLDEKTLALPDRRGNNRIDTLRNIITDPRVALLFFIPGHSTMFRVNGTASLTTDSELCNSFEMEGKLPRSVIIIKVQTAYTQCARAVLRAGLWDAANHVAKDAVPSNGEILEFISKGEIDGQAYNAGWAERAKNSMW